MTLAFRRFVVLILVLLEDVLGGGEGFAVCTRWMARGATVHPNDKWKQCFQRLQRSIKLALVDVVAACVGFHQSRIDVL